MNLQSPICNLRSKRNASASGGFIRTPFHSRASSTVIPRYSEESRQSKTARFPRFLGVPRNDDLRRVARELDQIRINCKSLRAAFTLNELLIVVAIVVLMLALAVPAFNVLTGSKSTEGATNQISAFLGQARAEAIGVQEIRGVMFFIDPRTDRVNLAMVRDSGYDAGDGVTYLDLVPDRDFIALPGGIIAQTVLNAATAAARTADGYLGFTDKAATTASNVSGGLTVLVRYGGVILFDSSGKLVSIRYGFRCSQSIASATGTMTLIASLLGQDNINNLGNGSATDFAAPGTVSSQIGLALFPREGFGAANYTLGDSQTDTSAGAYATTELGEETWIDNNAVVQLVNRYNGTLIKAE